MRPEIRCFSVVSVALAMFAGAAYANEAVSGGLEPLPDNEWDYAKARHLLSRAGFGGTPREVDKLHAMGLRGAVDYLVDFRKQPEPDLPFEIASPQPAAKKPQLDKKALAKLSPQERQKAIKEFKALQQKQAKQKGKNERQQFTDLREWWVRRMVESPRPLEEKLALFWHGHFATGYRTVKSSDALFLQNRLFRQHAAGNFGQMLHGIIHDPAMLRYLDNDKNVKANPNENLAREIMELFSMGEGNYTEQDIKEAARALTGYSFDRRSFKSVFNEKVHDEGPKTIFGNTGNWDGDEFVDLILAEAATPRFIARKLFVFFVHEDPGEQAVDRLAGVLRENDYELAPLLRTMFLSKEFYGPETMGTQIKSPLQLVVGSLRNLGLERDNYGGLVTAGQSMGQELFQPPNVKGWDGGRTWIDTNTLFARHNFAAPLMTSAGDARKGKKKAPRDRAGSKIRGVDLVSVLEKENPESGADVVGYLTNACLVLPLSESKRAELVEFIDAGGPLPPSSQWDTQRPQINAKLKALLVLIMSLPEFQLT